MAKVGIDNYKTGTKNNWRHQCWNEISRRVKNKRNATVLYLAAEQDLDRSVAIRRGFQANNLIAVDMRQSVVDQLRDKSKIAVQGRIEHIACAWADVDVVYADFCCGLTKDAMRSIEMMCMLPFIKNECVFLFNFMRGREAGEAGEWIRLNQSVIESGGFRSRFVKNTKNRAMLAVQLMSSYISLLDSKGNNCNVAANREHKYNSEIELEHFLLNGMTVGDYQILENSNPSFVTYKSSAGSLYFDTVIMGKPLRYENSAGFSEAEKNILIRHGRTACLDKNDLEFTPGKSGAGGYLHYIKNEMSLSGCAYDDLGRFGYTEDIAAAEGKVAAAKAVRTMRKNGTLQPCSNF